MKALRYILILIVIVTVAGGGYLLYRVRTLPNDGTVSTESSFPSISDIFNGPGGGGTVSTSTNPDGSGGSTQTLTLSTRIGTTIDVPDFTVGKTLLSGGYYSVLTGTASSSGEVTYNVIFFPRSGSFTIILAAEPLGEHRLEAEAALRDILGISNADMCRLHYDLGTFPDINSFYSGKNLGFSFCPGATKLP